MTTTPEPNTVNAKPNFAINAVINFFKAHRRDPSTKEVAVHMGVSVSTARKHLKAVWDYEGWVRISPTEVVVPVKWSSYGQTRCFRRVEGWAVTREALADIAFGERDGGC